MKVGQSVVVPVAKDALWTLISQLDGVYKYHPKVTHSPILGSQKDGVGAARRCDFTDGTSVVEKVSRWVEGQAIEVELSEMSMPLKWARATISIESRGAQQTQVSINMEFLVKFGPLGWLMGALMMRPMMKRMFKEVIEGMASHLNSGQVIGAVAC